jgi:RNA recognition motif-containing protein
MNIYVGNLPLETTEDELREAFGAFGDVATVKIVRDGATGESRGFGFVGMPSESAAKTAVSEMNGREVKGQTLKVEPGRSGTVSPGFGSRRPSGRPGGRPGGRGGPRGRGRR